VTYSIHINSVYFLSTGYLKSAKDWERKKKKKLTESEALRRLRIL
jgi:hypothetical protein